MKSSCPVPKIVLIFLLLLSFISFSWPIQTSQGAQDSQGKMSSTGAPASLPPDSQAASIGQWGPLMSWPLVAVHMVLLHTGQVLMWDAWELSTTNSARIWDPATQTFTIVSNPYSALFCAGQSQLADGRVIGVGGHNGADIGIKKTVTFDPVTQTWTDQADLNEARWYPSSITLNDGKVLALGGEISSTVDATIPEVYDPVANHWTQLPGANLDVGGFYPQAYLLPNGLIFMNSGPSDKKSRSLNLAAQTWSMVGTSVLPGGDTAMYLPGKIIASGGGDPVVTTTAVIDMNASSPSWRVTAPMAYPRSEHNLVLLPTGDVLAVGGSTKASLVSTDTGVLPAEMWNPGSQTWTTMAAMTDPRMYHSTALLLPDGSVLSAGGGRVAPAVNYLSAQIYYPPYFFQGNRPTILSAPAATHYNTSMSIITPEAAQISSVSFIRLGSVTHTFNTDQRFIPLSFQSSSGRLSVTSPANANIASPGFYMLFLVNANGVPSTAKIVQIGTNLPLPNLIDLPIIDR